MTQRRFNEAEVAAIFERATNAQRSEPPQLSAGEEGLSLAELQEIGREVGLPPELIMQAAQTVGGAGRSTSRTFLGLTIAVGRTVDLGRRISEEEWERLVVDLRETFDARGVVRGEGSLRQWTNGNLQALLEPTAMGHRLRLRTTKGNVRASIIVGLAMIGGAVAVAASSLLSGAVHHTGVFSSGAMLGVYGVVMLAASAAGLPAWARLRQKQMEDVAARLARTTATESQKTIVP
jgi:hypothetical protein